MRLQTILDHLRFGVLKGVDAGKYDSMHQPQDYPELLNFINLALSDLHTELPLRNETIFVDLNESISTYFLTGDYAATSTSGQPVKYIQDTADDPFTDNVITITKIEDELGNPYVLNDSNDCESITLPVFNAINVPNPQTGKTLKISYKANHPIIDIQTLSPTTEILIPTTVLNALGLYIKYQVYGGIISMEAQQASNAAFTLYQAEVERLRNVGVVMDDQTTSNQFEVDRWV